MFKHLPRAGSSRDADAEVGPTAWRGACLEVAAVALGAVTFVGLLWLARGELGMTWDEPYFFERQHDIRRWLGQVFGTPEDLARAFRRENLERGWRFCREVPDQHPPVPALLSLATGGAGEWLLGPLRSYRLSTVLLFAVAAGVLERLVRTRWGATAAVAAVGTLLFNPRILGDAQQITADSDLGAFWFLAAVSFLKSCETRRAPWLFGVLAGLAVMCKATGALLFLAMGLWAILYRPRGWWRPIAWSIPVVPATMIAVNPAWWPAPVAGMVRWVRAFFAYPQKVPIYYLGTVYDSVRTFLPWHNTVVLTGVMVPAGLLALAAVGLVFVGRDGIRRRTSEPSPPGAEPSARVPDHVVGGLGAVNFLTLMVMRMFPFMPAHDGLRQLVPAFYFLPVLAAYGAWVLVRSASGARLWLARGAVFGAVAAAGVATVAIHPFELSYYNVLIGGPRGAKAAGMESTYFWDAATRDVLDWMNTHLPPNATVLIFPPPNVHTFDWEQRWGRLRKDLVVLNLDPPEFSDRLNLMLGSRPCYLIFQMRQGLYEPRRPGDNDLFARLAESPALYELAPPRVGVRLLAIFDQDQFRNVVASQAARPGRPP